MRCSHFHPWCKPKLWLTWPFKLMHALAPMCLSKQIRMTACYTATHLVHVFGGNPLLKSFQEQRHLAEYGLHACLVARATKICKFWPHSNSYIIHKRFKALIRKSYFSVERLWAQHRYTERVKWMGVSRRVVDLTYAWILLWMLRSLCTWKKTWSMRGLSIERAACVAGCGHVSSVHLIEG
jgi:hypothetical protein